MLSIVKENIVLRASKAQSPSGETLQHSAGTSLSGRKPRQWDTTLDEGGIGEDPEASVKADSQSCQIDICLDGQDAERILGEIAFQLDKRILTHVFPTQKRLYGFNLFNMETKIIQVSAGPLSGEVDEGYRIQLKQRYADLMEGLNQFGYNKTLHPLFSEVIINSYGILKLKPDDTETYYNNPDFLKKLILSAAPQRVQKDMLLLLRCLSYMAQNDGRPLLSC